MFSKNFTYNKNFCIKSSVELKYINSYLLELGFTQVSEQIYSNKHIKIEIETGINPVLKNLNVQQNTIKVIGIDSDCEAFLNNFRLKFLSAGG